MRSDNRMDFDELHGAYTMSDETEYNRPYSKPLETEADRCRRYLDGAGVLDNSRELPERVLELVLREQRIIKEAAERWECLRAVIAEAFPDATARGLPERVRYAVTHGLRWLDTLPKSAQVQPAEERIKKLRGAVFQAQLLYWHGKGDLADIAFRAMQILGQAVADDFPTTGDR